MLQQYNDYEGHGFISQEQLDCVKKGMNWDKCNDCSSYRIAVMHHHYCPACFSERIEYEKPSSVVYDADRLMTWLVENNVKMLLHGHKHNTFLTKISYPKSKNKYDIKNMHEIYVVSTGGTGSSGTENKFSTITFDNKNLTLRIYKIYPDIISSDNCEQEIVIPID